MKTSYFIFSSILLLVPITSLSAPVKLESHILSTVDGVSIGITGDSIFNIRQYQFEITKILLGQKTPDGYLGKYQFESKNYSVQELRKLETESTDSSRFKSILKIIRDDFEKVSLPFQKTIQEPGVKTIMGYLIEESCIKRNRLNSLLYIWSKTDAKNEYELFDIHIKSIQGFEIFLMDLNNFLGDLIHSCPRAYTQYKEHYVDKFSKIKECLAELRLSPMQQQNFLKHVNSILATIANHEITKEKIHELYYNYKSSEAHTL